MNKNTKIRIHALLIIVILLSFTSSCKKDKDTASQIPVLEIGKVSNIAQTTAYYSGATRSDGGLAITSRGVCWDTVQMPTTANNKTNDSINEWWFTSNITGLTANTKYYLRAYATNIAGTGYGEQISFTTLPSLPPLVIPTITTTTPGTITTTSAASGGTIISNGGDFIIASGICWSTSQTPTIADSTTTDGTINGSFSSNLKGLKANTTYYVRAYATNSIGTGYGSVLSFTTQQYSGDIVTDIDGNVYHTVTIGTQVWMIENLKVTKYRNGDPIPNVTDDVQWVKLITGAYCNYDNDSQNLTTYGYLYNSFAVMDSRNIAPTGWHVPSDTEWTTLTTYLGGDSVAGGKMKEIGTAYWLSPNTGATNGSGFTSFACGLRTEAGSFSAIGQYNYLWSNTVASQSGPSIYIRSLGNNDAIVFRSAIGTRSGASVRCVKN
jgi:uncharacterized protein (TIGR02145 family)